eukprot:3084228-Pyramimonas_sp.AAC.2
MTPREDLNSHLPLVQDAELNGCAQASLWVMDDGPPPPYVVYPNWHHRCAKTTVRLMCAFCIEQRGVSKVRK